MSEEGIAKFFEIARERYQILLNRRAGMPKPWSKDPIFQNEYFCNVFREDDRTTTWFRENIRSPVNEIYAINPEIILRAIVAFRWFNKIETWEVILGSGVGLEKIFGRWDSEWIHEGIADHATAPYVTGAYIIKTPDGKNKVDGILWCIDRFNELMKDMRFDHLLSGMSTMQQACEDLQQVPFLGKFTAYQIVCDARFTKLLENASDIYTWTQPGPGSARGIGRTFYNNVDHFKYGSKKDEEKMIELMRVLLMCSHDKTYWPEEWPNWELSTVQHHACEVDKYNRCGEGGRMKRKYNARG